MHNESMIFSSISFTLRLSLQGVEEIESLKEGRLWAYWWCSGDGLFPFIFLFWCVSEGRMREKGHPYPTVAEFGVAAEFLGLAWCQGGRRCCQAWRRGRLTGARSLLRPCLTAGHNHIDSPSCPCFSLVKRDVLASSATSQPQPTKLSSSHWRLCYHDTETWKRVLALYCP